MNASSGHSVSIQAAGRTSLRPARPACKIAGWTLQAYEAIDSTQNVAASLPAWHAVLAKKQMAGRGQRDRSFTSDTGGLYLTAVVPFDGDAVAWRGFALAIGWAVRRALRRVGARDLRLRWPNDLMIGSHKDGGLLVTQGSRNTLCVGLGLNISNQPWLEDPALLGVAGRLADFIDGSLPETTQLAELMLRAIRAGHLSFKKRRLSGFVPILNRCWGPPRRVRLESATQCALPANEGEFRGLDTDGRVLLATATGIVAVPEHHIERVVELAG